MSEQTLDQVARALSTGMPRRKLLKLGVAGLAGAGLAATAARFGEQSAEARVTGRGCVSICARDNCSHLSGQEKSDCTRDCTQNVCR
jgi:hypothetical protein